MGYVLHAERGAWESHVTRFDPRFWTVNFPRPMMASVVTTAPDALRVDAVFYRADDLAGLIWEAEDRHDHALLAYATSRDFRGCRLAFRWRSSGVMALDAVNGPVLTIEGRDAGGVARAWYVRLWNYAVGTPEDAVVAIDFANVDGGFLLPGEADPVWAGDVDRMFVSLVPEGYDNSATVLATPADAWIEVSDLVCEGPGAVLAIGDAIVPEHGLRIASGYDDSYHLTPARLLRNALLLGYRGDIVHYVGMSHYFRLADGVVTTAGGALNVACAAWHRDFFARAKALGYAPILSLSYELFDAHCPEGWKQRDAAGNSALTGWVPPSTLLSPANAAAMAYLQDVARGFAQLADEAGCAVRFQVGEPWWWVTPSHRLCIHDPSTAAALAAMLPGVAVVDDVRGAMTPAQTAVLDAAGALLAESTAALVAAVRADHPAAEALLLVYLPTVLDAAAPEVRRANVPLGWASPAFDVLQLEDYDWVTEASGDTAAGIAAMTARLGYPVAEQHYFSGFVLRAEDAGDWAAIAVAADAARARGTAETFVWALPQVLRDGFTHFDEEGELDAFDDVSFPIGLGREALVAPEFSTSVVTSAGGRETRNAGWAGARTRFDVGPGVRSEADITALLGFFRARLGPARGFRLRDPFDASSNGADGVPGAGDQVLGTGDGARTGFALVKDYGGAARRITRPVAGTVRVAVGGIETQGFTVATGGLVVLDMAPAPGVAVTAGFRFDVPVRFAEDRIEVNRATFRAGAAASVPLVEIREDG